MPSTLSSRGLFVSVTDSDGQPLVPTQTATGYAIASGGGVQAEIRGFRDALACRVRPSESDRDVVQFACGSVAGGLCDALYSPKADTALIFKGDGLAFTLPAKRGESIRVTSAGPLLVTVLRDFMRGHHGLANFVPMDRSRFKTAPSGWCSWYYYYLDITEAEVIRNTDWLAEHLKPFGLEWIQIDDGWQGVGSGTTFNRDFFVTCERDFPRGMKWIADYIREKGLRPGLWCIPCTHSNDAVFQSRPEMFLRRSDGSNAAFWDPPLVPWQPDWRMTYDEACHSWGGKYYIDPTSPAGQQYFRDFFDLMCNKWGYDYIKIDNQAPTWRYYNHWRQFMAHPETSGDQIYAESVRAMKEVMGPDRFLLNCGSGWPAVASCEGVRTGGDVDGRKGWPGVQEAIKATMHWVFLNTIACYTDPDAVCVRDPLTLDQARVWANLTGITGQLLMASDKMDALPDERVELLRRILPVADIRPMELYPLDDHQRPSVFDLKVNKPEVGVWDVVVLFNWTDAVKQIDLTPERLGLSAGEYVWVDYLTGDVMEPTAIPRPAPEGHAPHPPMMKLRMDLPPTSCRTISCWRVQEHPMFVGTSRHITQGVVDVRRVTWDAATLTLSGVSEVVANDPYRVRVFVPAGYRVASDGVTCRGAIAELALTASATGRKKWAITFARS